MAHTHAVPVSAVVPGHRAPAAGVEAPFDLLAACHDRVRRSLDLLERLQTHIATNGCDDDARSAATDVMRYFDIAAPLHHQDEELHVFPAVLTSGDAASVALIHKLQEDHRHMHDAWTQAREVLQFIVNSAMDHRTPLNVEQSQALLAYSRLYAQHMEAEEKVVYPLAQQQMTPMALANMRMDMGSRRGLVAPNGK